MHCDTPHDRIFTKWTLSYKTLQEIKADAIIRSVGHLHPNYFQPDWQLKSRYATSWLGNVDVVTTRYHAFGMSSLYEWLEYAPRFSLLTQGILDQPCAPMFLVNGKYDLQVPVEDIYLLLEHGSPKTARIYPEGHMGNTPQTLPTVADWIAYQLQAEASQL